MIERKYNNALSKAMAGFPVVALVGPRQCGKTTIAKWYQKQSKRTIHYFDLESSVDRQKLENSQHILEALQNDIVIIDEVQRMPELFPLLRHLVDKKRRPGKFLLLGSATPELIQSSGESLAGRIYYIDVSPFNYSELPIDKANQQKHWFRGGFPDSYLAKTAEFQQQWMDGFVRTFIERDLNQLFGVSFSSPLMMRLWRMLAHHHGGVWNAQSFAKGLDVSPATVNRYIDYLCGAYMVRKLPSYHFNSKKSLVKAPKVYIRDSGVVNYLLNIANQKDLLFHPLVGNLWEGYILEQILELLPRTIQPYFYRTHDGAEIDLVLVKGIKPIACIEIKSSATPNVSRGLTQSIIDLNTSMNILLVPGEKINYALKKGIQVLSFDIFVKDWLKKLI